MTILWSTSWVTDRKGYRYEPVDPSGDHHHHVVFDDGAVGAFSDGELEVAIHGLGERLGLDITGHDVILRARRRA